MCEEVGVGAGVGGQVRLLAAEAPETLLCGDAQEYEETLLYLAHPQPTGYYRDCYYYRDFACYYYRHCALTRCAGV